MNVMILGATGMLGNMLLNVLARNPQFKVVAAVREPSLLQQHVPALVSQIDITCLNVLDLNSIVTVINKYKPQVVINCVGVIKQREEANEVLATLPINALFPHQLANVCELSGTRVIQISTDCVFSGSKGNYLESDIADATDLYGRSKYMGELTDKAHTLTLRTSIVGHELKSNYSLIDWFLSQQGSINGYTNALYSGLTTLELARLIERIIVHYPTLSGLYHVASDSISKYELLHLVNEVYKKKIDIIPAADFKIDRTLCAGKFNSITNYQVPSWPSMIQSLYEEKAKQHL